MESILRWTAANLSVLKRLKRTGRKIRLTGNSGATSLQSQKSEIVLSEEGRVEIELPAYSFTVLRF